MPMPVKFSAEVSKVLRHGPDVATFEFRCLMPRPRWKPGQFLHLALDPYDPSRHWPESRCFTMASGSLEKNLVRLTIAAKGTFTRRILSELQPGRKVWMKAPYGDFIVRTSREHDVVLIAGGTGVTPFVAFMEDSMVNGLDGNVWLHYGARSQDLLVFRDFADRCARQFPSFRLHCYAETGVAGPTIAGRIDLARAVACAHDGKAATYYLCGPQEMINAFRARLTVEFAVPESNVKIDTWE
ncbi:MAG: ferredoxin--NADP reductase [Thermoguttaceae bacterium]